MAITEQIKVIMIKKGIKQKDLIKALHSNKSDISNAIAGRNRPILQKEILNYLKLI
jgi:DNA-binding Xre family transcriptional regulator